MYQNQQMSGIWDWIKDVASDIGLTSGSISKAVAVAYASPSTSNIRAVEEAYRREGKTAPRELMNELWSRYYGSDPYYSGGTYYAPTSNYLPWIIGGGVLLWAIMRR